MNVILRRHIGMAAVVLALVAACSSGTASPRPSSSPPPAAATLSAAPSVATWGDASAIKTAKSSSGATYLVDAAGRSLYIFDTDSTVSACNRDCLETWPPLRASGEAPVASTGVTKKVAISERMDGSFQVTYGGVWLYYYSGDRAAGETKGDGIGGVWHLATP